MPRAVVNGVSLNYDEWGAGHPLLLLMGFGDGLHAWANQIPAFSEKFRTIAVDHRGSGESEAPPDGYSIPQFSDDAIGLLDALGVERTHVLGYSMGGRVGQDMAARYPDRVSALILAASAAKPNPLNVYSLRASAWLYETCGPEAAAAFGPLISFTHDYFKDRLEALSDALGEPVHEPMPIHAYRGHVEAIENHDTTPMLHRIAAPTLVLVGDGEWLNPMSDQQAMLDGIPNATLRVLQNGGHGFLWEIPDAFNEAAIEFLEPLTP